MSADVLLARTEGRVRHLTFNRPDALNALNRHVLTALESELAAVERDDAIGAVLIDGAGDRAFCAGADLTELAGLDATQAHELLQRGQRIVTAVEEIPVPVVAAVDGHALGGGFEIMLACPVVLASERSSFGLPEARLGLMPGYGGTQRLRRAIGHAPAMAMLLSGRPIDADRAWHFGLLSGPPAPAADLPRFADELAADLAGLSRPNLARLRTAARSPVDHVDGLRLEASLAALTIASADGQEGIRAFLDRRTPMFGARGAKGDGR
jgi:enoyl-CoA hydratase